MQRGGLRETLDLSGRAEQMKETELAQRVKKANGTLIYMLCRGGK